MAGVMKTINESAGGLCGMSAAPDLHESFLSTHRHALIEDEAFTQPVFVTELFLVSRNATMQLEDVAKPALPQ